MPRYQTKLAPLDPCPVEHVVKLVGGKWKARILYRLRLADASLAELLRHLPRARAQVLTAQLTALSESGLVERLEPQASGSWGRFAITARGRALCDALDTVARWGAADIGGWSPPQLADVGHPPQIGSEPVPLF